MTESIDDGKFVELLTSHQARLRTYALSLLRNPSDADDVLQNACIDLWKKREQYDEGRPFLPWASRVVLIEALRQRRRAATDRLMFDETLMNALGVEYVLHLDLMDRRRELLQECIEKLSSKDRAMLSERYRQGVRPKEMAAKAGRPATTVYSALSRIREALYRCIEAGLGRDSHPDGGVV